MKNEELESVIANLCQNFESVVFRIRDSAKRNENIQRELENLENEEIEQQKDHDKLIFDLSRVLEMKVGMAKTRKDQSDDHKKGMILDKSLVVEFEMLKRKVKDCEKECAKRMEVVRQKKQKLGEEDKSLQALIKARNSLETEQHYLEQRVEKLKEEVGKEVEKDRSVAFGQTREIMNVRESKLELKRLQDEERNLFDKVKKIEKRLKEDEKKLEGKLTRLETLKQLNRTLTKKAEEKRALNEKYTEICEQSINLQYLYSEAMRSLGQRYDIKDSDISLDYSAIQGQSPDQVLRKQVRQIEKLKEAIRDRTIQIYKGQYEHLVRD